MRLNSFLQRAARKIGYDVVYFDRIRLLRQFGINLIFDVGANIGQYGAEMRYLGYRGRIVSFEPLLREFKSLADRCKRDKRWEATNCALGDRDGVADIHISGNSMSSSLLRMLPLHLSAAPESQYTCDETVKITTLDAIFTKYYKPSDRVLLKLDTQGYEYMVLQGAINSLPLIIGIQIEMSLVPLYDGDKQLGEMTSYLTNLGFSLMSIEPVFRNSVTGQMLSVDGSFYRNKLTTNLVAVN
jgi:FkbM family methyltransferase